MLHRSSWWIVGVAYLNCAPPGERNGDGVEWYVCGSAGLAALVDRVVEDRRVGHGARLHQKAYAWRRTLAAAAIPSTVG